MSFELRWAEYEDGTEPLGILPSDATQRQIDRVPDVKYSTKLQYRLKEQKFYDKDEPSHTDWSEWKDVPVVRINQG